MSTFGGKIQEIPYMSVDRFDGENRNSEVYFLSHCHSDHMIGLNYPFWDHLINSNKFLYASPISCAILARKFLNCSKNIKELDVYNPSTINNDLSVTVIPAGHCPGSVMFLFVTETKKILYTGDYRIHKSDIKKIKQFYNSFKKVIDIDKIYLDTTFFLKAYLRFPKRIDSLSEICKIIKNHIECGKEYIIKLQTGAYYGYEFIFQGIYNEFKMPIHVNERDYHFYSLIPELDSSVTMDGAETQIHCNCAGYRKICDFSNNRTVLILHVTAWMWNSELLEDGISSYDPIDRKYQICFSTHASLEEGEELIRFLKPKAIEICVKSDNDDNNSEMNQRIDDLLNEIHKLEKILSKPRLFQTCTKTKKKKKNDRGIVPGSHSILESPPREKRHSSFSEESGSPSKKTVSNSLLVDMTHINFKEKSMKEENVTPPLSIVGNKQVLVESCLNITMPDEEDIAQSSQISLEELQIQQGNESDDIILGIIEDKIEMRVENTQERVLQPENIAKCHNIEDNVILSLIDSQEIVENENSSANLPTILDNTSQNVLLDIIDL